MELATQLVCAIGYEHNPLHCLAKQQQMFSLNCNSCYVCCLHCLYLFMYILSSPEQQDWEVMVSVGSFIYCTPPEMCQPLGP